MRVLSSRHTSRWLIGSAAIVTALGTLADDLVARTQARREFVVTASDYKFQIAGSDKREIRVNVGDLVRITFDAQDIPHSFTTEETTPHYRINRRAEPGKPVTFEFRADQAATVPIVCMLTMESRCKDMRAELIVVAK